MPSRRVIPDGKARNVPQCEDNSIGMFRRTLCIIACTASLLCAAGQIDFTRQIVSDLKSGKYAEAEQLLKAALQSSPRDARLWTLNGLALEKLHKRSNAKAAFAHALRLAPDYVPALEGAAQLAYEDGDPDAASLLQRIVRLRPRDRTSHALLAQIAFKKGECETARTEFAAAKPEAGEAGTLREYGACLVANRQAAAAVPVFARLRVLKPNNDAILYNSAIANFLAGQFGEAIQVLQKLPPKDADAYDLLAEAYAALGKTQEASQAMRHAIALKPEPRYYADFAYLLQESGKFKEGLTVANEGLERNPNAANLYVARGVLHNELGQYALGEADFRHAEQLDPDAKQIAAAEGLSDLQRGNLSAAGKTIRERLARRPNDAFLHYLLAEVLVRQGASPGSAQFEEALQSAQTAVKLRPDLELARGTLAKLYLEAGDLQQAIRQSRLACKANPYDEKALYHLILALKRANQTAELPALFRRLTMLRTQKRAAQTLEH